MNSFTGNKPLLSGVKIAMTGFHQDLTYALRGLLRSPGFALTAIATAALGLGATTAVFSVVDRVLFRPLPYAAAANLVSVGMLAPLDSNEFLFALGYDALRRQPGPFTAVTAFQSGAFEADLNQDRPARLRAMRVDANFFDTLGVRFAAGRTFTADEDRPNGPPAVILSHALWRTRLADSLGKTIVLDGAPVTVVGVLPPDFEMPTLTATDLLLPLTLDMTRERTGRAFRVFARLAPALTATQAHARLQPFFAEQLQAVPPRFRKEIRWVVQPLRDRQSGSVRLASLALLGAALAVLLIACANIANLLLARAVGREREFSVRAALGASRGRLVRQALTESLLLGLLGGAAGCALAWALLRAIVTLGAGALPRIEQATLDGRVLLAATLISLVAGLLFGLVPALRSSPALGSATRVTRPSRGGLRSVLVTAQIAFSLVLLTGAGLLLRTLTALESERLGLVPDHVITASFVLGKQRYGASAPAQVDFFTRLEERLTALPGVTHAAITDSLPPTGGTRGRPFSTIEVEGEPPLPEGSGGMVAWRYVTPGYFATLGIPVRRGRAFLADDRRLDAQSIVLSESLARKLFPSGDALGRRVLKTSAGQWHTVIGITADVRNRGLQQAADAEYYVVRKPQPDSTFANAEPPLGWRAGVAVLRTPLSPSLATAALRSAFTELDATLPVTVSTMTERVHGVTARPRFHAWLLAAFAATGLALAALGLFGLMSYLVSQRQRELGIRAALGATPRQLLGLTLRPALLWIAAGLALGLAGSLAASRWLQSMLYGVAPGDPAVLAAAMLFLALAGIAAVLAPAVRAMRVGPAVALREE